MTGPAAVSGVASAATAVADTTPGSATDTAQDAGGAPAPADSMKECPASGCSSSSHVVAGYAAGPHAAECIRTAITDSVECKHWERTGAHALYTTRPLKRGEVLASFADSTIVPRPSRMTLQVGVHQHMLLSPDWLQYVNHSCSPSCSFNTSDLVLEVVKGSPAGTELTFFYPTTEWEMSSPFQCECGCDNCLGQITGASQMPAEVLKPYQLSSHIKQLLRARDAA